MPLYLCPYCRRVGDKISEHKPGCGIAAGKPPAPVEAPALAPVSADARQEELMRLRAAKRRKT